METRKLQRVEGFLIVDLPEAEVSVGPARLGSKLLVGNATNYARELTYGFASLGHERGGMSIGLKVDPDVRDESVAAVAEELAEELAADRFIFDAGLRMTVSQLGGLGANDPRNNVLLEDQGGISLAESLTGLGAVTAAAASVGVEAKMVAIEGLSRVGVAIAREVERLGGSVVRISTAKGCISGSFTSDDLQAALVEHGAEAPGSFGEIDKPWSVWRSAGVDMIFAGSGSGALSPQGAPALGDTAVIGTGVSPISTKALAILNAAGAVSSPAFVSTLGVLSVGFDSSITTADAARQVTQEAVTSAVEESLEHDQGLYVGACARAEEFMRSWTDDLPFGRPMA